MFGIAIDSDSSGAAVICSKKKLTFLTGGLHDTVVRSDLIEDGSGNIVAKDHDATTENTENTEYSNYLRLVGRDFSDPVVAKDLATRPFSTGYYYDNEKTKRIVIYSDRPHSNSIHTPEKLLSCHMSHVVLQAKKKSYEIIERAVITVPSGFTHRQRKEVLDAARHARLFGENRLINRSTAAAYYNLFKTPYHGKTILYIELGTGTFEASIMSVQRNKVDVLATVSDTCWGTSDLDACLLQYCIKQIYHKHKINLHQKENAIKALYQAYNKLEVDVLDTTPQKIILSNLFGKQDVLTVEPHEIEFECDQFCNKIKSMLKIVLRDAAISKEDIHIIECGGKLKKTSRVVDMVRQIFKGCVARMVVCEHDEITVIGAAWLGHMLTNGHGGNEIIERANRSIGIKLEEEIIDVVIYPDMTLPVSVTQAYGPVMVDQKKLEIAVYEGEGGLSSNSQHAMTRYLRDPTGKEIAISLTLFMDKNGMICMTNNKAWQPWVPQQSVTEGDLQPNDLETDIRRVYCSTKQPSKDSDQTSGEVILSTTNVTNKRGALIVLEGIDKVGKTTQCKKLFQTLQQSGHSVAMMRFPDRTTEIGKTIHKYLNDKIEIDDRALHLLFSANRWERVSDIKRQLAQGITLIVDRYVFSGAAFASAKMEMELEWCIKPDIGLPKPDVVLLLKLDPEKAALRYDEERYNNINFQQKVAGLFDKFRQDSSINWKVIDASFSLETVQYDILHQSLEIMRVVDTQPVATLWT